MLHAIFTIRIKDAVNKDSLRCSLVEIDRSLGNMAARLVCLLITVLMCRAEVQVGTVHREGAELTSDRVILRSLVLLGLLVLLLLLHTFLNLLGADLHGLRRLVLALIVNNLFLN